MDKILEINNLSKKFATEYVLKEVSLSIKYGEIISLVGPSGSGKSTILRCINGLEDINKGNIIFKGSLMGKNKNKQKELRKKIGIVFQHFNLFPHYSVLNNITNPLKIVNNIDKKNASNIAKKILNKVGLLNKKDNYPFQLSGGEKQRVAIARSLAMDPDIMMFDEPTSALDPELSVEVFQTIKDLANEGMTMLIATHDINFVKEVVEKMIFIDKGKIVEMGPPDLIFSSPKKERTKKFLSNLIHY